MVMKIELVAVARNEVKKAVRSNTGNLYIPIGIEPDTCSVSISNCIPLRQVIGTDVYTSVSLDGRLATVGDIVEEGFTSMEDAFIAARNASLDLVEIANIGEMFGHEGLDLFALTTNGGRRGASVLSMTTCFRDICRKLNVTGVYLLPSSINEALVVPDTLDASIAKKVSGLKMIVREINGDKSLVPEEIVLSDNVFYYKSGDASLSTV